MLPTDIHKVFSHKVYISVNLSQLLGSVGSNQKSPAYCILLAKDYSCTKYQLIENLELIILLIQD